MTREDHMWDLLQTRWSSGEPLTTAENAERLSLAAQDVRRMRELEVPRQLQLYLSGGDGEDLAPEFIARVLAGANEQRTPHLRLVAPGDELPVLPPPPGFWSSFRGRLLVLGAAASVVAAALFMALKEDTNTSGAARTNREPRSGSQTQELVLARSELVFASGQVRLNHSEFQLGKRTLGVGEQLATGRGRLCFTVEPSIDVCLGPESSVVLEGLDERDVRINVERGQVVAALATRKPGHSFTLKDASVTATARGTVFGLTKDPKVAVTKVAVIEGRVEVSRDQGAPRLVRAHTELEVLPRGALPKGTAISRNHEAQLLSLVAPREFWHRGELGILSIGHGQDGSEAMIGSEGPFLLPVRTFLPIGQQRVIVRDKEGAESLLDVEVRAGETLEVDASTKSRDALRDVRPDRKSASDLLGEARAALKRGDSGAALAAYRRLGTLYPASPEAATVLVTVGKLELRQNSPVRALSAFDAYLKRGGSLEPEALAGKIRALRALGRMSDERQAIQAYLKRYPNGFEAVALEKRLEVLSGP